MIFKDHLYSIVSFSQEATGCSFQIRLNPAHEVFAAHFPGEPILPGACIVQMVTELVSQWQQVPLEVQRVSNLKFLSVISPLAVLELEVICEQKSLDPQRLQVKASVRDHEIEYSKMTLVYAHE